MLKRRLAMDGEPGLAQACPVCGSRAVSIFMELPRVPIQANVVWPERPKALAAPLGEIRLGFCAGCGLIYNCAFDPSLVAYTQAYENSLHFSPRFQRYAQGLAADLVERYDLHGKEIVEIGSGQGDFLRLLCELGDNRGVGFDPSYIPRADEASPSGKFQIVQDLYSERYADQKADFVCCRHVLEHIPNPMSFLVSLRRTIGRRSNVAVYFEVPNALSILQDLAVWDIIYEHCSYFCSQSLSRAFWLAGFRVARLSEVYDRQFLALEALPAACAPNCLKDVPEGLDSLAEAVMGFAAEHRSKVEAWRRTLERLVEGGQRVVAWGAGSKGVTFLNTFKAARAVEVIVDINPRKHGAYIAGSGQRIVPPEFLRDYPPDVVIIMNAIYLEEIRQTVAALGLTSQLLTA